jgi:hypothetical protein
MDLITTDLTLYISTMGSDLSNDGSFNSPWATIQRALDYLNDKAIAVGVTVTISVADGTYNMPGTVEVKHRDGANIQIIGNQFAESQVCLLFVDCIGFFVTNGHCLGLLDGFTVKGNWAGSGNPGRSLSAIRASHNGVINLGDHVTTDTFYYGIHADQGGFVEADSVVVKNAGDCGLFAYEGGVIESITATVIGAQDITENLGGGALSEIGGVIRCNSITVSGCRRAGIMAIGGSIRCDTFNAHDNTGHGVSVERNGSVDCAGACFSQSNGGNGINCESGGFFRAYGVVTSKLNGGSGLFGFQAQAQVANASVFNQNAGRGVYANAGSKIKLGGGSSCNSNSLSGVELFGNAYLDVADCIITSNGLKGIFPIFGSFVYAKGANVANNSGGQYAIPLNTLSGDGCLIKTT